VDKNIDRVVQQLFEDEVLVADHEATSAVFDLQQTRENDLVVQYKFTASGAGTIDIELAESVNGDDWELNGTKIGTGLTLVGNASDIIKYTSGKGAAFGKIIITETGKASPVTVSLWICTR